MTYTLAMASDQGIQIAEDGVAEVSMTDARALLTQLIRGVRWGGKPAAFTERGKRVAMVISPDAYEQAKADARVTAALKGTFSKLSRQELEANPLFLDFMKQFFDVDSD
jgi:prevent-host-death family protein